MRRYVQRGLRHCRLAVCTEVGPLRRSNVLESEWRIDQRLYRAQQHRSERRTALPLLKLRSRFINVYMEDAKSGKMKFARSVDIRGNTDESWSRGLKFLLEEHVLDQ